MMRTIMLIQPERAVDVRKLDFSVSGGALDIAIVAQKQQ